MIIKTHPLALALIITFLSTYSLSAIDKTNHLEQAREHVLETTQQELEKGTISKQIAERIFELMNLFSLFIPALEDENRGPIQTTLDFFGATNECYYEYLNDESSSVICH